MRTHRFTAAVVGFLVAVIILQWVKISTLSRKQVPLQPSPVPRAQGKIAIVIDDWGYNVNNLGIVRDIPYPFTASVLPNLAYTREVAEALHDLNKEIIVHLPLEPHEKFSLEARTIKVGMPESQIRKIVSDDVDHLPFIKGVSNHMGSKATENRKTMETVLDELKKRKLYFLDSLVSPRSICRESAVLKGVSFAKRDVFLDNKEDTLAIRAQINRLKKLARAYGKAIGIGHDRRITLEVLKDVMPELEKEGFKFVFVSEIVS